ncbi:hypothetical protein NONO_c52710 [Nocardia nova SH22a]|uniref:Uncharacterized protein n=1 Tax=Nocardia nova SH22a TaxID=1415166 RepID=W5TS61_9NOCA|nr:hypothetical protein [Nocardia nova]AHH20051.1 hypothetical protein NONO_c52710 [Nocardia nova SH22a]
MQRPQFGHAARGDGLVLGGEIVAPDPAAGAPDFARLQQRMHAKSTATLMAAVRGEYVVLDVLFVGGFSTTKQSYLARRAILDALDPEAGLIRVPPFWTDIDPDCRFNQILDTATGLTDEQKSAIYAGNARKLFRRGRSVGLEPDR